MDTREVVRNYIGVVTRASGVHLDAIMEELSKFGVVVKVDRELPEENSGKHTWYDDDYGQAGRIGYRLAIEDVEEAGYVAVEPL